MTQARSYDLARLELPIFWTSELIEQPLELSA